VVLDQSSHHLPLALQLTVQGFLGSNKSSLMDEIPILVDGRLECNGLAIDEWKGSRHGGRLVAAS